MENEIMKYAAAAQKNPSYDPVSFEYPEVIEEYENISALSAEGTDAIISIEDVNNILPLGTSVQIKKVTVPTSTTTLINRAVEISGNGHENVIGKTNFEITLLDDDNLPLQPLQPVKINFQYKLDAIPLNTRIINVYHITDNNLTSADILNVSSEIPEITDEDAAELLPINETTFDFSVEATNFSWYTVEFTYGACIHVMDGGTTTKLSTIQQIIGLFGTVTNVSFTDPNLVTFTPDGNGDWDIVSLQAFTSVEHLILTINNINYDIIVTDTQSHTVWAQTSTGYFKAWASIVVSGTTVTVQPYYRTPNANYYTYSANSYIDSFTIGGNEKGGSGVKFTINCFSSASAANSWAYGNGSNKYESGYYHAYWAHNIDWPWGPGGSHTFSSGTGTVAVHINNSNGSNGFKKVVLDATVSLEYSVSYNANGGSSTPATQTSTYGSSITLASAISHAAGSTSRTISITYNGNGNTGGSTAATSGTQSGSYPINFANWRLNSTSGTAYNAGASFTIPASNSTMYAAWSNGSTTYSNLSLTLRANGFTKTASASRTISITYNANGGSGTTNATSGTQTGTTTYPFSKWALGSTSGTQYAAGASVSLSNSTTAYAIWGSGSTSYNNLSLTLATNNFTHANGSTSKTVTITYNGNGATGGSTAASTGTSNGSYPITFSKWALGSTSGTQYTAGTSVSLSNSTTAYAIWANGTTTWANTSITLKTNGFTKTASASKTATISYNANNGTGTLPTSLLLTCSGTTTYPFSKWALDSTSGTQYAAGASLSTNSDHTMYAIWSSTGTTTYNNGSGTLGTNNLTRTGYQANGWNTNTGGTGTHYANGATYSGQTTTTLYAQWTANTYTIAFNANGGSGSMSSVSRTYDAAAALPANTFTAPSGYSFYGWAIAANTASRTYTNQQSVSNLTATNGDTVTLYAVWQRTLTFKSGTNQATSATAIQVRGGTAYGNVTFPAPAAISGFTALGWRDDTTPGAKEYGSASATSVAYGSNSATTLYAVYSRTATFYSGIAKATTTTATQYYTTANTYTVTPSAAPATIANGWTALGWRDDTTAGAKEYGNNGTTAVTGSAATYYAVYSRTITVNYAAGGGTGTMSASTATSYYNSNGAIASNSITLKSNTFTRDRYAFSSWNITNPAVFAVSDAASRTATAQWTLLASIRYWTGSAIAGPYYPYVWTGSAWAQGTAYVWDGSSWIRGR